MNNKDSTHQKVVIATKEVWVNAEKNIRMKEPNSTRDKNDAIQNNPMENYLYTLPGITPAINFGIPANAVPIFMTPEGVPYYDYSYDCNVIHELQQTIPDYFKIDQNFLQIPPPPVSVPQQSLIPPSHPNMHKYDDHHSHLIQKISVETHESTMETMSAITNAEINDGSFDVSCDRRSSRLFHKDEIPNPRKIAEILRELQITQREMNRLRNSNNNAPAIKQERNRVASRICRLKKKATYETNKLKSYHLEAEHNGLRSMIKDVCIFLINNGSVPSYGNMYTNFYQTSWEKYLPNKQIAGNTESHVDEILKDVALGKEQEVYRSNRYKSP